MEKRLILGRHSERSNDDRKREKCRCHVRLLSFSRNDGQSSIVYHLLHERRLPHPDPDLSVPALAKGFPLLRVHRAPDAAFFFVQQREQEAVVLVIALTTDGPGFLFFI
jgi:hypothetical protein